MNPTRAIALASIITFACSSSFGAIAIVQDPAGKPAAPTAPEKPKDDKKAAPPATPMDPVQAEWMKKMEPGEKHKVLAKFEGDFDVTGKAWMAPGQAPSEITGSSKQKMVLGGRFLQENFKSKFDGQDFQGYGLLGYDTVKNKFTMTWADTMSTFHSTMEGDCDKDGTVITLFGDVPGPGRVAKMKYVLTVKSPESHSIEFYDVDATGKGTKTMELNYAKSAKADKPKGDKKKDKKDKPAGN